MNSRRILLGLNCILGPQRCNQLLQRMTPEEAWQGDEGFLRSHVGWKPETISKFVTCRQSLDIAVLEEDLYKHNVSYVCLGDAGYPELLATIYDPPWLLYYQGNVELLQKSAIAVVGSRKPTIYGREVSHSLAQALANHGVVIVSGLARGIDTQAHLGALTMGSTIAVLGCGVDVFYPRENAHLQRRIATDGLVVSEFALHARPQNWHFPMRNRIISGLSLGTLVVEAEVSSGSLITADQALEQGREVFAIPGPVTSPFSAGCNNLIKQGARLVSNVDDILDEFGLKVPDLQRVTNTCAIPLSSEERLVIETIMTCGSPDIETLVNKTGLPVKTMLVVLTKLEVEGIVVAGNGQIYTLKQPSWNFI